MRLWPKRRHTSRLRANLELWDEAAKLLPVVTEMAVEQGNALDLVRLGWLQAKVAAGQGRAEEAIAKLEKVSSDFTDRRLPYEAALSSLDLAILWLKAGRNAEVALIAVGMKWIFEAKKIQREALMALRLFCDAAEREAATVELARQVIADLERAERSGPAGPRGEAAAWGRARNDRPDRYGGPAPAARAPRPGVRLKEPGHSGKIARDKAFGRRRRLRFTLPEDNSCPVWAHLPPPRALTSRRWPSSGR